MAWAGRSISDEKMPADFEPPFVLEYCPADVVEFGEISTTERISNLIAMGFEPVALVCRDSLSATLSMRVFKNDSNSIHVQLVQEADKIFAAASNQGAKLSSTSTDQNSN
jgi:hypothetical protein